MLLSSLPRPNYVAHVFIYDAQSATNVSTAYANTSATLVTESAATEALWKGPLSPTYPRGKWLRGRLWKTLGGGPTPSTRTRSGRRLTMAGGTVPPSARSPLGTGTALFSPSSTHTYLTSSPVGG